MVIQPLTDKKTGKPYTNVQLIKIFRDKLRNLKDGVGAKTKKEKDRMETEFYRICGGSQNAKETMDFMDQIADMEDEQEAQRLFERALLPVESKRS